MESYGFDWGDGSRTGSKISTGDSGHFEYHPAWAGLYNVKNAEKQKEIDPTKERNNAKNQAAKILNKPINKLTKEEWLPYVWNNAGACYDKESIKNLLNPNPIKPNLGGCDCDNVDCQVNCISRWLMEVVGN